MTAAARILRAVRDESIAPPNRYDGHGCHPTSVEKAWLSVLFGAGAFELRRRQELLEVGAALHLHQERLVARVLEQAPDEVGHARDEVADGAVGADLEAIGDEG